MWPWTAYSPECVRSTRKSSSRGRLAYPLSMSNIGPGYPSGCPCPSFATTTGGRQTSIPPVAPSVAASKHTSARIETCFNATTTDIYNP